MNVNRALLVSCFATLLILPVLIGFQSSTAPALLATAHPNPTADPTDGVVAPARHELPMAGHSAPIGSRFRYELCLDLGLRLVNAAAREAATTGPAFGVTVSGTMAIVVLGRRDHELLVGYRPDDLRLAPPGASQPETVEWVAGLQTAIRQGFDLRMDERGCPSALRFLGTWTADQRNFARALLQACRWEFQPGGDWSSRYDDAMGTHTFDYRAEAVGDDVRLVRTRTGFVPFGSEGDAQAAVQLRGVARATFTTGLRWLSSAACEDEVSWSWLDGALRVSTSVRCSLRCVATDTVGVDADWDLDFVDVVGRGDASTMATDPMRGFWDARLGSLDVPILLSQLRAFLDRGQEPNREFHEMLQMLAELVRRDPTQADHLAEMIQSARLTGQAAADVLAAIGMAGHGRAQAALQVVFENGLVEGGLRRAAVEAMFQVEKPGPALVDSLQRSLHAGRLDVLEGSAMLALGAFGSRGAMTSDGRPVVEGLLRMETAARRDGLTGAYFEALGNAGDAAVVPLAQRLLQTGDPIERARAVTALRRVGSPEAVSILQSVARGDVDAEVRRQALQAIAESAAAWTRDVLIERAAADTDSDVRRVAYSALAMRARTDPVARQALVQRLGNEQDPDLLQMLRSLLQSA